MTDRELVKQWLQPGAFVPVDANTTRILIAALRERLAQPEITYRVNPDVTDEQLREGITEALLAKKFKAQPEPEPEVSVCCQDFDNCLRPCTPRGQWIAHKAAQREWQGLTDEEIAACIQMGESGSLDGFIKPLATYRAIEAKLKEKNT